MPIGKIRRTKTLAIGAIVCLAVIFSVAISFTAILYWQSRYLLGVLQTINVGEILDTRALATVKEAKGIAYVRTSPSATYFYIDPSTFSDRQYASQFLVSQLENCRTDDCTISIPGAKLQLDHLYEFFGRHPVIILPIVRSVYGRASLHRWLAIAWLDPIMITVKKGVVRELDFRMRSLSIGQHICPQAEVRIAAALPDASPWEVITAQNHMTGNSDCGSVRRISITATTGATREEVAAALYFNTRCLLPAAYCTECDMLPKICPRYLKAGDGRVAVDESEGVVKAHLLGSPRFDLDFEGGRVARVLIWILRVPHLSRFMTGGIFRSRSLIEKCNSLVWG